MSACSTHCLPFRGLDQARFVARVARGGERPPPMPGWPPELPSLLADCWHVEAALRPSFDEIARRLRRLLSGNGVEIARAEEFSPALVAAGTPSDETASVASDEHLLPPWGPGGRNVARTVWVWVWGLGLGLGLGLGWRASPPSVSASPPPRAARARHPPSMDRCRR